MYDHEKVAPHCDEDMPLQGQRPVMSANENGQRQILAKQGPSEVKLIHVVFGTDISN